MPRGAAPGERRGGRAKGTVNKRTAELMSVVHNPDKLTPKFVMLEAMRIFWQQGKIAEAVECAAKVAPYEHPRLTTIDARVDQHTTHHLAEDDYRERILSELARRRVARDAAGDPQQPNGQTSH